MSAAADHLQDLESACNAMLIESLSPALRASIDRLVAAGESKRKILATVKRAAGGKRRPVVLAVEAYLGADQLGRIKK